MSIRHVLTAAVALIGGFGLAAPAAAHVSSQSAVSAYTMSAGRITAIVAVAAALIGVGIGGLALARFSGRISIGNRRRAAVVALLLGLIGIVLGGLVAVTADGGLGTGNGLGGGIFASVLGLISVVLGGRVLTRSQRTG